MTTAESHLPSDALKHLTDYIALEQLGRALWRTEGSRGAAVLVGAGVSRGALLSGADMPPPPLWEDLARDLRAELYPSDESAAPRDPLRLAEEYRTYFGQTALDEFLRRRIADGAWRPSPAHHALLELPWSDVLTTNYDTLLERAARGAERAYEPVLMQADLSHARAPRIVKLHGSIGSTQHFVIAEEDYRTYPATHAAFVNLARQVFVENELCLIGFSGDDPNFLAWAGWVRDHLGSSARRIYLAGALNLGPAKRKFLEARNIAPIDVYTAVAHLDPKEQHGTATRLILNALAGMRPIPPQEWEPRWTGPAPTGQEKAEDQAKTLDTLVDEWRRERLAYPGWVVCPAGKRRRLRHATDAAPLLTSALELLKPARAAKLMFELCWRHRTALWPVPSYKVEIIMRFADPASASHLSKSERLVIGLTLVRSATDEANDDLFIQQSLVSEALAEPGSDALAELNHERAVRALANMDVQRAVELDEAIVGPDPHWILRRAAILAEAGHLGRAEALVMEALADLRARRRENRQSIWVESRLAWATLFANAFRRDRFENPEWPDRFRETRCDPFADVEAVGSQIAADVRKQARKPERLTPLFDPGSYRDPSRTIRFGSSTEVQPYLELDRVLSDGGVPPRLNHLSFFGDERLDALGLAFEPTAGWYSQFNRIAASRSDPLIDRYFGRVAVAVLPPETAGMLIERTRRARDYWTARASATKEERSFIIERLALTLELLGRLAIRCDSATAAAVHLELLDLWSKPELRLFPLHEPIERALKKSFEAVEPRARPTLVAAGLGLPLSQGRHEPDPLDWLSGVSAQVACETAGWSHVVRSLLEGAAPDEPMRASALSRLVMLHNSGGLSGDDEAAFSAVAWKRTDGEPPLPGPSSVYPHFWARLSAPEGIDAASAVRSRLFDFADAKASARFLPLVVRSVVANGPKPTSDQARAFFDRLVQMRPRSPDADNEIEMIRAAFEGHDTELHARWIGSALALAFAPCLADVDLTKDRADAVGRFVAETGALTGIAALLPFVKLGRAKPDAAATFIRRGLLALSPTDVADATEALERWRGPGFEGATARPVQLVEQLVSSVELRRAPGLWRLVTTAATLVLDGATDDEQNHRLAVALSDLLAETDYRHFDPLSEPAGTVSLVRRSCVRLAEALAARSVDGPAVQAWGAVAASDPLPEVRFALSDED